MKTQERKTTQGVTLTNCFRSSHIGLLKFEHEHEINGFLFGDVKTERRLYYFEQSDGAIRIEHLRLLPTKQGPVQYFKSSNIQKKKNLISTSP